jgi:hypothetical protein
VRSSTLTIQLLGAYHDGRIEFVYPDVHSYDMTMITLRNGHGDWLLCNARAQAIHALDRLR